MPEENPAVADQHLAGWPRNPAATVDVCFVVKINRERYEQDTKIRIFFI